MQNRPPRLRIALPDRFLSRLNPSMSTAARAHVRRLLTRGLCAAIMASAASAFAAPLSYNKDIRPILFDNCFRCHGPDSASRKAGLRLDKFDEATRPDKDG